MIAEFEAGQEIVAATKDVFATMLMTELTNEAVIEGKNDCEIRSNLTSMIGLGGGIRGVLAIHCPADIAKAITGSFLGMEVTDLDDDVKDAIGEIANMVAGNLKIAFGQINIDIQLAIPTSIIGESFCVCGMARARRFVVPFCMDDKKFWIELLYVDN